MEKFILGEAAKKGSSVITVLIRVMHRKLLKICKMLNKLRQGASSVLPWQKKIKYFRGELMSTDSLE